MIWKPKKFSHFEKNVFLVIFPTGQRIGKAFPTKNKAQETLILSQEIAHIGKSFPMGNSFKKNSFNGAFRQ